MLLLRGGEIVDGTGAPSVFGDVLIRGDRIAAAGRVGDPADAKVVDCAGLIVAPGFIDAHSHSDLHVLANRPEKALQGVTTEIVGNCGFSAFPAAADREPLHEFANGILCGDDSWGWPSAQAYLETAERASRLVNVFSLTGHGSLRIAFAGMRQGPLDAKQLDGIEGSLDDSLAAGACGLSTGLMYSPGESAPREEIERLCRAVARRGKVHATHMRDYGFRLLQAVREQIDIARRTGCRLQISHLQAVGTANWAKQAPALEEIERARADGIDVAFDCYPYVAGSTVLTQWLPQTALEGGIHRLMARLRDNDTRARLAQDVLSGMAHRWTDLFISSLGSSANCGLVGRNLQEIAEARGCAPIEAMFDLLVEENGVVNILEFNQSEENLRQTLTHPFSNIVSDGFYVRGRPHPRLHGAFAEWLGKYCREKRWLALPSAVRKITAAPAERFGLRERGRIAPGCYADLVVFDAARIGSPASYEDPELPPEGIRHVFRGGKLMHP